MSDPFDLEMEQAARGFAAKDYPGAEAALRRALALRPDHPNALHNLGSAFLARDQAAEALAWYARAVAAQPDFATAHLSLAKARLRAGQVREALAGLESMPARAETEPERSKLTAICRAQGGDAAGALRALEQYRALSPATELDPLVCLASHHAGTGDARALARVLVDILRLRPDDYPVYIRLAQALIQAGDRPGFQHTLEVVQQRWPASAPSLEMCAHLYTGTGHLALAVRCAARARARGVAIDGKSHPHLVRWSAWL